MGSVVVGALIALLLGLTLGSANERAKRARSDYRRTRSLVLGMRKTAWTETISFLKIVASISAVVLVLLAIGVHLSHL
jgi:hypothetical protein